MTKLPAKETLDGSKLPKTTTGEMKDALGKLRDYLNEMLGEDSADKEAARLALGIDLAELETRIRGLEEEIAKKGVPVGSVHYFAMPEPPAGYLKADGSAIGRNTYPDLFAAIGTTFGEGDGETTFNLPDLMGRFSEGSLVPGKVKEAGLPNIAGGISTVNHGNAFTGTADGYGAIFSRSTATNVGVYPAANLNQGQGIEFLASRSNPIYGASNTVQPAALTLLPCIRAFDAAVNPGLIDVTALAQEMSGKVDKVTEGKPVRHIVDTGGDDNGNWWRQWSDGWLEQGGLVRNPPVNPNSATYQKFVFYKSMLDTRYTFLIARNSYGDYWPWILPALDDKSPTCFNVSFFNIHHAGIGASLSWAWYVAGWGAPS